MSDTATNSAVCRRIPLTVNSRTLKFIYPDRPSETIWNREDLPQICFGETVIFCFTFLDEANQAITFLENDSFTLAADADFIHGEDPLMLFAGPECVNLPGDWDDADPLHGKISIRVNCNTVGFEQKIGSAEDLIVRMEVRRISGNFQTVLLHADAIARNTVFLNEHSPEMAAPEYYTAAQTEQLFAGFSNENDTAHNALEDKIKSVAGSVAEIQLTADSASANSAAAQSTADTALANAAAAQSTADTALANAAAAQSTADTALANAADAQSTADTALANAADAQSTADTALANAAAAQSTADTALANAATAQSTADTALANAAAAQSTADTALANAADAQSTADTALANAADAQTAANSKLSAPVAAGTAGQVLTLDTDGVTPVWANPTGGSGGGGGLTKWSASGLETREIDTQYTATQDGYIIFNVTGKMVANAHLRLMIDGIEVASSINYDPANVKLYGSSFLVPVFSGQTYILEYGSYIMGDYGWNLYFAPCV